MKDRRTPRTSRTHLRRRRDARQFRRLIKDAVPGQIARADQFATLPPTPQAVVFLGDSITEAGIWGEWLPDVPVLNRGIGGETAAQILRRIDTAIHDPAAVFLLAGTNDLHSGTRPRVVAARVVAVVEAIAHAAPGVPVLVQSIMPRAAEFSDEIAEINRRIRRDVSNRPDVTYIDLWPALADRTRALREELTFDSLHLTGAGYVAWLDVLRPHIERLVSSERQGATV